MTSPDHTEGKCANYVAPLTCLTAPSSATGRCDHCKSRAEGTAVLSDEETGGAVGWLQPKPEPLACYDCGLRYGEAGWCDAVIPTDVWARISPTGDEGGVLCLTCMARRLVTLGLTDVPLAVTSGPWVHDRRNKGTAVLSDEERETLNMAGVWGTRQWSAVEDILAARAALPGTADTGAREAVERLADQAWHTAGGTEGRALVHDDRATILAALAARAALPGTADIGEEGDQCLAEDAAGFICTRPADHNEHRAHGLPEDPPMATWRTADTGAREAVTGSGRPSNDRDGACICDYNPDTTDGPQEECPFHGRPYAYWVERGDALEARLRAALEARLRAALAATPDRR